MGTRGMYDGNGQQPHDGLFRAVLGLPEHASSELRSVLSPELAARIDLDRLEPIPGTFVDKNLARRHTDVLFRTRIDAREAYLYVLLEHQRTPDSLMAFRMLAYQMRIWKRHLAEAEGGGSPPLQSLPPIIPVVVYQGPRTWTAPTDLGDLLDIDHEMATLLGELLPHVHYLLDDLTKVDDEDLRTRPLTPATKLALLFLKKVPGDRDIVTWMHRWLAELQAVAASSHAEELAVLLTYAVIVSSTPHEAIQEFAARLGPDAEEIVMTTGQDLIARGRAEGQVVMLLEQLEARFGPLDHAARTRLHAAKAADISAWSQRFARGATTLDEVFD